MFHREFIVDNYTPWVRGDVSKLEAFASICPVRADHFTLSAFVMNFPGATRLDSKELDKLPLPNHPRAMLMHSTSGMSILHQQQSCKPRTASNQGQVGLWWHLGNRKTCIFLD